MSAMYRVYILTRVQRSIAALMNTENTSALGGAYRQNDTNVTPRGFFAVHQANALCMYIICVMI